MYTVGPSHGNPCITDFLWEPTCNGLVSKNIVTKLQKLGGVQNLVPRLEWLGNVYLEAHPLLS